MTVAVVAVAACDCAGLFAVGPESVGANPGPVCYGKGGSRPAITDANVVLGRIVPEFFPNIFGPHVSGAGSSTVVACPCWVVGG